jgi:tRNA modification GTPase
MEDTIAAISTPAGIGGIGIIRVSGDSAISIVNKIFRSSGIKDLNSATSHTIHYGKIYNLDKTQIIDEVLVSIMKKPRTFTRDDVVEINCHGGIVSTRSVLEVVLSAGARLAEPGEFTKRAFVNGRIDLVQSEAIIDVINSKTNIELKSAIGQMEGSLSYKILEIRKELIGIAAHLQAEVDFPEEDIVDVEKDEIIVTLENIIGRITRLIETADLGKIIRNGLNTVIIGKPNVGKSSLLNALVRENRAIVTEIPGTTRDVIEEFVNIKGIPLRISDTAGIRETEDIVEKIGVEKSLEILSNAELSILILDGSEALNKNDIDIIDLVKDRKVICLVNKADLETKVDEDYIEKIFGTDSVIRISIKEHLGLDSLENKIKSMFVSGDIDSGDSIVITNLRHKDSLIKAKEALENAMGSLKMGIPIDMLSIDIKDAVEKLGEIIGLTVSEEIVSKIFEQFCLGK